MKLIEESTGIGHFDGWKGDTVIELMNGQKWRQSNREYLIYHFYMPNCKIWEHDSKYFLQMEDVDEMIEVNQVH